MMDNQWSKYELAINFHKYSNVENLNVDLALSDMGIKLTKIESKIVPNRVRKLYMELNYSVIP